MRQRKLLLLNGGHSEIPLIVEAKKLGWYVITTGNKQTGIGHIYANENIFGDYSNIDLMYEIAKHQNVDAIVSCCNDFGIITASYISEKLKLSGHDPFDITCKLHHKDTFRKLTAKYSIHAPCARDFHSREEAYATIGFWEYPIIIKPIDLSSGVGISTVKLEGDFFSAVNKAFDMTRAGTIVIEPFIEGTAHSFSTFIINQKVVAYFSDNEYSYKNPFMISSSAGPATDIDKVKNILINDIEKLSYELNLVDGIVHAQYILSENIPYILEITRRCSGDLYSVPVEYARDLPWAEMIVRAETGMIEKEFYKFHEPQRLGGRHCIMGDRNGVVKDVIISNEIKDNIYKELLWWKPGFTIKNYLIDKLGILFLKFSEEKEMLDKINRINELVKVAYEN